MKKLLHSIKSFSRAKLAVCAGLMLMVMAGQAMAYTEVIVRSPRPPHGYHFVPPIGPHCVMKRESRQSEHYTCWHPKRGMWLVEGYYEYKPRFNQWVWIPEHWGHRPQ